MKKYHYLVIFLIGFFVLMPLMWYKLYTEHTGSTNVFAEMFEADRFPWQNVLPAVTGSFDENGMNMPQKGEAVEGLSPQTGQKEEALTEGAKELPKDNTSDDITDGENPGNTISTGDPEEKASEETEEQIPKTPEEFFHDTLFIGDSRTMGLAEYANLGNAAVFANSGMSVYRLYTLKNALHDQGIRLEDILAEKSYRRIYFMLGINELGYDFDMMIARYEEEILKLQQKQPEAEIILEANLHVTEKKSGQDDIFNNENINRVNESIRQIAERNGFAYIDVNEVFDDENGALNPEYTHDEVHVLGKYYQQWADWICEKGV